MVKLIDIQILYDTMLAMVRQGEQITNGQRLANHKDGALAYLRAHSSLGGMPAWPTVDEVRRWQRQLAAEQRDIEKGVGVIRPDDRDIEELTRRNS